MNKWIGGEPHAMDGLGHQEPQYRQTRAGRCFPAGTLVHTDKGLVPIQEIRAGDRVLSRPEQGGSGAATAYQPVKQAFCAGERELVWVCGQLNSEYDDPDAPIYMVFMTPDHPVWDERRQNWVPAADMETGALLSSPDNANPLRVLSVRRVHEGYVDQQWRLGGCYGWPVDDELDQVFQFSDQNYYVVNRKKWHAVDGYFVPESHIVHIDADLKEKAVWHIYDHRPFPKYLKVPVYHLEVENFHTYFVGEPAIWVRSNSLDEPA